MADPIIHITRAVQAFSENARAPIALKTIREGALRPTTALQRRDMAILAKFAGGDTITKAKELHQMAIKKHAFAVAHQHKIDVEFDWDRGSFNIRGAKVTNL